MEATPPDSVEELNREIEAQQGIVDIFIKYRESQQAKFAPFQTLAGVALGAVLTFLTTKFASGDSKTSDTFKKASGSGGD